MTPHFRLLPVATVVAAYFLTGHAAEAAPPFHGGKHDAVRGKLTGGLPLVFSSRPSVDGHGRRLAAVTRAPVLVRFASVPTESDVARLEAVGAEIVRRRDGRALIVGTRVACRVTAAQAAAVAQWPRVDKLELDGTPFGAPPPMEVTALEVEAHDVWRTHDLAATRLTGAGVAVCDLDSGIDVFHPLFFRADGGYFAWTDADGDGVYSAGVDTVDLGYGSVPLNHHDSLIKNIFGEQVLFNSQDATFQLGLDWLFADDNLNGVRDYGPEFGDAVPTFGERLLVADDVNGNGLLDVHEKVVALGTHKVRSVKVDAQLYRRGESLSQVPIEDGWSHGTSSAAIIAGGQHGLMLKTGIAPGADLIAVVRGSPSEYVGLVQHCIDEGAQVVLHEYAPWVQFFLDGSSALEQLIDETSEQGVAHVNPAGNLSGSRKLFKRDIPAGETTTIDVVADGNNTYQLLQLTVLWREPGRELGVIFEDPDGRTLQVPTSGNVYQDFGDSGLTIYADRYTSDRGTTKVDLLLFEQEFAASLDGGTYKLHLTDPATGGAPLEVIAYVGDNVSSWGEGIHFPEFDNEDHLIGWPGTADEAIAVAAYTGHGFNGGTTGERAPYSGRGRRIDGEAILSISAPDDPVTAAYRPNDQHLYAIFGGTSGASPHVAGAAALLMQQDPTRTGGDVRQ